MVRDLVDDWRRTKRRIVARGTTYGSQSATLVCGQMIGEALGDLVADWHGTAGAPVDLAVIGNTFFGPRVRVSGLLTAGDVVANAGRYTGDAVILPSAMLDKTGTRTLDNVTPAEIEAQIGKPVHFAGYLSEVDTVLRTQSALTA
jgi:NifB/MoaA-like Fe-S oxidoreductase